MCRSAYLSFGACDEKYAEFVRRMQQAEQDGREVEEGIAIADEVARAIKPHVQGIQVVAPDLEVDSALAVLKEMV